MPPEESLAPAVEQITSWFAALDSRTRRLLFAEPRAEVPEECAVEVLSKGRKLAQPWFAEVREIERFRLPEDVADYVDGLLVELQGWWVGLSNGQRLRWADVEMKPVPEDLQTSYPGLFEFVVGDDGAYADSQVIDFVAVAAA